MMCRRPLWLENFASGAARAVAGRTTSPLDAYRFAGRLIGRLEIENGDSIHAIAARAAHADGVDEVDGDEFGHKLAVEASGGVGSWFDGHRPFAVKVPRLSIVLKEKAA